MTDYLIVGSGLAGIAFAEYALQHNKTVLVFENDSQHSSSVAAGLYNPVILKRFSGIAQAQQQLDEMNLYYAGIEEKLGMKFNHPMPILRKFVSVEEQNNWFSASDNPKLSAFLSTELITKKYDHIVSPHGYGQVFQTGYVDTKMFLEKYRQYLIKNEQMIYETFEYPELEIHPEYISYKNHQAKNIIFAEGFAVNANPFFNYLPLAGTKGELLIIKAPQLQLDAIVKSSLFVLPLGNGFYKVGATYNWDDKTEIPTAEGRAELVGKIREIINCDFEIISHQAGIRPTVKDRKALIGTHPEYPRLYILNGLGTRGVMLAPIMAKTLLCHIETRTEIPREINIERFRIS